jgi:hypothetical protein
MSDNIQLQANLSVEKLVSDLQTMRAELEKTRTELADSNRKIKEGFDASGNSVKQVSAELNNLRLRNEAQIQTIQKLRTELEATAKANTAAFDPAKIKAYEDQISKLEAELTAVKTQGQNAAKGVATIGTESKALGGVFSSVGQAFKSIFAANSFLVWTAIIAGVIEGAKLLWEQLTKLSEAEKVQIAVEKDLQDIQVKVASSTIDEQLKLRQLLDVARDKTKTDQERGQAIQAINEISPEYLGNITKENIETEKTNDSIKTYLDNLDKKARGQAYIQVIQEKYVELLKKENTSLMDNISAIQLLWQAIISPPSNPLNGNANFAANAAAKAFDNRQKDIGALKEEIFLLQQNMDTEIKSGQVKVDTGKQEIEVKKAVLDLQKQLDDTNSKLSTDKRQKAIDEENNRYRQQIKTLDDVSKKQGLTAEGQNLVEKNREAQFALHQTNLKEINDRFDKEAQSKRDAANKKRIAEEEATARKIVELEKQLAQARIEAMGEGRGKDIAQENSRFDNSLLALETLRNSHKTTQKEIQIINQIEEALQVDHYKKLQQIDLNYYLSAAKALEDAQKQINRVLLTGKEKELVDLENTFSGIFEQLAEDKKKALQGSNSLEESILIGLHFDDKVKFFMEMLEKGRTDIQNKYANERLKNEQEVAEKTIDLLRVQGLTEEQLVKLKESLKFEAQKTGAKKRLEALIEQNKIEKDGVKLSVQQMADLFTPEAIAQSVKEGKDIFEVLGIKIDEKDPAKLELIKKLIISIVGEIKKPAPQQDWLAKLLGVKDPTKALELDTVKKAFLNMTDEIGKSLQPFVDIWDKKIQKVQEFIDKLNEQIDSQQQAVDKEKALMEKGYANNLQIEQKRLADLKKQKDQEVEQEKKLLEQKKALQKAQIIADSFSQVSNLITAASEIFKALAFLGPIGVALATATTGIMLTGFIASKVAAFKSVNDATLKFGKGGSYDIYNALEEAPSHDQHGAGLYDERTGEKLAEFEGKEKLFVVNKGSSKKYEPLLDAINKDQLSNWTYEDLKRFIQPQKVEFNKEKFSYLSGETKTIEAVSVPQKENKSESLLQRIALSSEKLLEHHTTKEQIIDQGDRTIIKKGKHTRIILKDKKGV